LKRLLLTTLALAVFLTAGVPRFLAGDVAPTASQARAGFAELCRHHGGTPAGGPQAVCTVRYGRDVYRMDAITDRGFDADTARFQRQGCELARQRDHRRTFVFHPATGVCEHRP
jgi:hypothetical protein